MGSSEMMNFSLIFRNLAVYRFSTTFVSIIMLWVIYHKILLILMYQ